MKIKLYGIQAIVLLASSFMCVCGFLSSCIGDDYDISMPNYKQNVNSEEMLKESKSVFIDDIGTVFEPDFTTLFNDSKHLNSTSAANVAKLNLVWDDALFTENSQFYTLRVPLEGAAINSASISCQTDVGEGPVLLNSQKTMHYYLVFIREKTHSAFKYKVATTLTGHNPYRNNHLTDCVIYSDENGLCSGIVALNGEVETELKIEKPEFTPDHTPEYAYINLNIVGYENYLLYIDNTKELIQQNKALSANDSNWTRNMLDSLNYCGKCGAPSQIGGCPRDCSSGSSLGYHCSVCKSPVSGQNGSCNNCGSNPNRSNKPCTGFPCSGCGVHNSSSGGSSGSGGSSNGRGPCPAIDPLDHTVILPNPDDCTSFFMCSNGYPILQKCPENLHYNARLNVCDWPHLAGCKYKIIDKCDKCNLLLDWYSGLCTNFKCCRSTFSCT